MSFSMSEGLTGAGQGAQMGAQYGGAPGAIIGAAAGFILGGTLGGNIAAAQKRDLGYADRFAGMGRDVIGSMDPWSSTGAEAYQRTAQAMTPEALAENPELQYMVGENMRLYTQKMKAKGKSLSGEFVRGAQDTYLNSFAEAQKAIMGPGMQAAQIGAGVVQGQVQAQESITAAALGVTPQRTNYQPLMDMTQNFITGAFTQEADWGASDESDWM
jgi:hypothetical protein